MKGTSCDKGKLGLGPHVWRCPLRWREMKSHIGSIPKTSTTKGRLGGLYVEWVGKGCKGLGRHAKERGPWKPCWRSGGPWTLSSYLTYILQLPNCLMILCCKEIKIFSRSITLLNWWVVFMDPNSRYKNQDSKCQNPIVSYRISSHDHSWIQLISWSMLCPPSNRYVVGKKRGLQTHSATMVFYQCSAQTQKGSHPA
jgi:hypothetical protein